MGIVKIVIRWSHIIRIFKKMFKYIFANKIINLTTKNRSIYCQTPVHQANSRNVSFVTHLFIILALTIYVLLEANCVQKIFTILLFTIYSIHDYIITSSYWYVLLDSKELEEDTIQHKSRVYRFIGVELV